MKSITLKVFLFLILLSAWSCSSPPKTEVHADTAPSVAVVRAERKTLTHEIVLAAEFRPYQEVDLHAKIAGYMRQIRVDVGDRVTAGQSIATIEAPELADDETQAEATRKHAEAELIRAKGDLVRAEAAHQASHLAYKRLADVTQSKPNLVAQQEIDNALAQDRVGEAQIDAAKAAVTAAEEQVRASQAAQSRVKTLESYEQIVAPFSGVISKRYADPGAMIPAGTASTTTTLPVVKLSQIDLLRLVVEVPESAVPTVHVGQTVRVNVSALKRSFDGRVSRFSNRLSTGTRTMETEIDVPNPKSELIPGMDAEVVLTLDRRENTVALPISAVSGAGDKATLFVVENGTLAQRDVKLGLETAEDREVLSNLKEGDLVVTGGKAATLKVGDRVTSKEGR
jgi:RND family efflux transporter MFP subunit